MKTNSIIDALPELLIRIAQEENDAAITDAAAILLYYSCREKTRMSLSNDFCHYCILCHQRFEDGQHQFDEERFQTAMRYLKELKITLTDSITLPVLNLEELEETEREIKKDWNKKE